MADASAPRNSPIGEAAAVLRRRWLSPALFLTAAMALVLALNLDKAHFYARFDNDTAIKTAIAENLSPQHKFRMFTRLTFTEDGELAYDMYSRFPIGGFALIKLVILPFGDNVAAKVFAARMLMLAFLAAAAFLAYYAIARIASNRWIALTAVLVAFSSYYILRYSNVVSTDFMMGLFAVMLTFHGMIVFVQYGRFRQLLAKTCIALLITWHVYGLLLPFIALGLGGELINAIRARRSLGDSARQLFSAIRQSRYLRLGLAALLFGAAMLTFNVLSEYDALNGETPIDELPAVESALDKPGFQFVGSEDDFPWAQFLRQQFYRIAGASFPYALTQIESDLEETAIGVIPTSLGVAALVGCLIGTLFVRRFRIPLAAMVLSGFCWALLIRNHALETFHHHEAIYYIGVPLTLATILLASARFRGFRLLLGAAALAALAGFGISAHQVVAANPDQVVRANARMQAFNDFSAIREIAKGQSVFANQSKSSVGSLYGNSRALSFLLAGSPFRRQEEGAVSGRYFVLATHRDDDLPLLTPDNAVVFLYGPGANPADLDRALYDSIASDASGQPAASAMFNAHIDREERALIYTREPCAPSDAESLFFLHIAPERASDLPRERQKFGFDARTIEFHAYGLLFEGKCAARVPLPDYPIRGVRTGQWTPDDGELWDAAFPFDPGVYRAVYESAAAREPDVRAAFDLRLDKDARALTYLKEPCAPLDVEPRFFLHVTPERATDLPEERRELGVGFDALDFDFRLRGAVFDGKCAARVPLPDYPIRSVRTGQWTPNGGELWDAAFPFDLGAYRAVYESAALREPDVRAVFDLYLDEDARELTYLKEPCAPSDATARFFLHVAPERASDLPRERRELGFEALDFDFHLRGAAFDGKCAAKVPLPDYPMSSIRTGQWIRGQGEVWNATVPFGAEQARRQ